MHILHQLLPERSANDQLWQFLQRLPGRPSAFDIHILK